MPKQNRSPAPTWKELRDEASQLISHRPNDKFMETVLKGAFSIGRDKANPIRGNLCATAMRELVGHVLHALAPDTKVIQCPWYRPELDTRGPTRRQRITFIMQGGLSNDFVEKTLQLDVNVVRRPLLAAMDRLNKATHVRINTVLHRGADVRNLMREVIQGLITMWVAAEQCRSAVERALVDHIDQAVMDGLISEHLEELDVLSTRTRIESHDIDVVKLTKLDSTVVKFRVSGDVHVELQYGSDADQRSDVGYVTSNSYPYTARLSANVTNPLDLRMDRISADTDRFYQ